MILLCKKGKFAKIFFMEKRVCAHCGKGRMKGHTVSHAKNRARRYLKPNLHHAKIMVNGVYKQLLLCTRCLRMLKRKATAKQVKTEAKKA